MSGIPTEIETLKAKQDAFDAGLHCGYFTRGAITLKEAKCESLHQLARLLEPKPQLPTLNVNCRSGFASRILGRDFSCKITGVDPNAWNVFQSAELNKDLPDAQFYQAKPTNLPFCDKEFSFIFAMDSLYNEQDVHLAIAEYARVLKKDGRIALSENTGFHTPNIENPFSVEYLHNMFNKAGFEIVYEEDWTEHLRRTYELALAEQVSTEDTGQSEASHLHDYVDKIDQKHLSQTTLIAKKVREIDFVAREPSTSSQSLTSLVMLSGGIDSVYTLWKILTETNDHVVAHHINLVNHEKRYKSELKCCREIVKYLRETVRYFEYYESSLDHRCHLFFGFDMISVGFEAGLAAHSFLYRNNKPINRWMIGHCEEEAGWSKRWKHVLACFAANYFPHEPPPFFSFPIVKKQEQIEQMPNDLVLMCWGCRRPILQEGSYIPCGFCDACNARKAIGIRLA